MQSDLGVNCLPVSHLWDTRHKWVKVSGFMNKNFVFLHIKVIKGYFHRKKKKKVLSPNQEL